MQTSLTMGKKVLVVGAISQSLLTNKKQGKIDYKEAISCYEPQEIYNFVSFFNRKIIKINMIIC
jgi:hypothetical protein